MSSEKAVAHLDQTFQDHVEDWKGLVEIPSVSFEGFPREEVDRSAAYVEALLKKHGFENVEIVRFGNVHPYVIAEKIVDPKLPTLLLYAHHDVQPPGREEIWNTPPFIPTFKDGPGGERMYARGSADDKAGVIVHTAAVSSCLQSGGLPLNVKLVVEGEEEIGSLHLYEFLKTHKDRLDADVLVLTDTVNFDCGVPALTTSLRGIVVVDIEVRALQNTIHSGMWGGPVPDPAMALSKCLGSLIDENGEIAIPAIQKNVPKLDSEQERALRSIPFEESRFKDQCGLVKGAKLLSYGINPFDQIWNRPSLAVSAIQSSSRVQAGNTINDIAWARVSIRLAPGMDPELVNQELQAALRERIPWGLEVSLKEEGALGGWSTNPYAEGRKVFEAASRAMTRGYGREPYYVGCGGSIPFVEPFAKALGGAPALLVGIEDPFTNAHGENESALVSDLKKACLSEIYLFEEIAKLDF